jgi:hypothetical protein
VWVSSASIIEQRVVSLDSERRDSNDGSSKCNDSTAEGCSISLDLRGHDSNVHSMVRENGCSIAEICFRLPDSGKFDSKVGRCGCIVEWHYMLLDLGRASSSSSLLDSGSAIFDEHFVLLVWSGRDSIRYCAVRNSGVAIVGRADSFCSAGINSNV